MDDKQIEALKKRVKDQEKSMYIHVPYLEATDRMPDFEVEYQIDLDSDLSDIKLSQGVRCDFLYEGDDPKINGIHMIWPEFLNSKGEVILDKKTKIEKNGKATMWISHPESRATIHRKRISVGARGYWVIGSKKVADVVVSKILGLFDEP